jgi:viroplasmin and RNaseH domain-containing protein
MVLTVFNATDRISATFKTFRKVETAKKWIDNKRNEFLKNQGYYRTNTWEKIHPNDIDYVIVNQNTGERIRY